MIVGSCQMGQWDWCRWGNGVIGGGGSVVLYRGMRCVRRISGRGNWLRDGVVACQAGVPVTTNPVWCGGCPMTLAW